MAFKDVYLGNQLSTASLVSSGTLVGFFTHPSLLEILWTWVSTPIPVTCPHATFIVMCAILGPTPGSFTNSSTVGGMSPLYFSAQILVASFM